MSTQPQKFEDAFARLSEIVTQLETGETGLEESLQLYTEGMNLVKFCGQKLTEAEKKIEQLTSENAPRADNTVPLTE
jgi:exodeoxyribonuclease VII small subunit